MKVRAIECSSCGYIIYSRAHHDYHSCPCGGVSVDGGFDYFKVSYNPTKNKELRYRTIEVQATKAELYDDWNTSKDKYGRICPNDISFKQ